MGRANRYRVVIGLMVIMIMAGVGYYMWCVYRTTEVPKDATLVKVVEKCLGI